MTGITITAVTTGMTKSTKTYTFIVLTGWMDGINHSHEIVNKIPSRTDAGSNRFGTVCSGTNQNTGTQLPIGDGIRNYCGLNTSRHTRKTSAAQATQQIPATVFDGRLGHYKKRKINLQLIPGARPYSQRRPYPVPFQRKKLIHEELCVWRISRLILGGTAPSNEMSLSPAGKRNVNERPRKTATNRESKFSMWRSGAEEKIVYF